MNITRVEISGMPLMSVACFAATGFMARKVLLGTGYKISSAAANALGYQDESDKWNQNGDHYLILAKKDAIADLTAATGFIALGLASYAEHDRYKMLIEIEKERERIKKEKEIEESQGVSILGLDKIILFTMSYFAFDPSGRRMGRKFAFDEAARLITYFPQICEAWYRRRI